METDLGEVVFGPLDIKELEKGFPDPLHIADEFEDAVKLISSILGDESEEVSRLDRLVEALRDLPSGLPLITENSTDEEIIEARDKISRGKAAGEDGMPPDLLKELYEENLELLTKILRDCWGRPPGTWRDGMIIPLHTGGKMQKTNPDNYRGIALLSGVGKLFTRIIATRLTQWVEETGV